MNDNNDHIHEQKNMSISALQTANYEKPETIIRTSQFSAFAPPGVFGPLQRISEHIGRVTMKISFRAESDAATVVGKVVYWLVDDYTEQTFFDEITITTGNAVDAVKVAFKQLGVTGTPITGTVS